MQVHCMLTLFPGGAEGWRRIETVVKHVKSSSVNECMMQRDASWIKVKQVDKRKK